MKKPVVIFIVIAALLVAAVVLGVFILTNGVSLPQPSSSEVPEATALSNSEIAALDRADRPLKNGAGNPLIPDFSLSKLGGGEISFAENDGKIVVMNFWASWCGPCQAEMPDFQELYNTLDDDVVLMMVNMTDGQRETKTAAESYISQGGYTFPVYLDDKHVLAQMFGVSSIPMTIVTDTNGYLHDYILGMTTKADVEALIASAREASK